MKFILNVACTAKSVYISNLRAHLNMIKLGRWQAYINTINILHFCVHDTLVVGT
jgi:hypothetical protein